MAIQDYVKRHGQMLSIYELMGVYGFNQTLIENVSPFISLELVADTFKQRRYFKHEILLRSTTVVEKQEGYLRPDSLSHYAGPPYSALLKYKGAYGKDWSWHLSAEQDRGETWFQYSKTTDFLSAGIQYKDDGIVSNVILGDYRVRLGQGLVVNNNFGYGKSSQVTEVIQKGEALRRFTSTSEFDFFRGVGTHLKYKGFDALVGLSSRLADASLDSVGDVFIRSLPQTGLHRTSSELDKYKKARISDAILSLAYTVDNFNVGMNVLGQNLSHTYMEEVRLDNIHTPVFSEYFNASMDYSWNVKGMMLFGEVAMDKNNAFAFIQGVNVSPSSRVGVSLVYRNYSKAYYAMYGQAFGEGSEVNNEEGFYIGTNLLLSRAWSLDTYFDWYRFPWLRYGVMRPTTGYDVLLQPNLSLPNNVNMHWQLKYEEKEGNLSSDAPHNTLQNTRKANFHFHISSQLSDHISIQSRVASSHALHLDHEHGYLIFQDVKLKTLDQKLSVTLRYALYNTDSYESRIYTYESDVLYLSSTPAFYGKGCRAYVNGSYKFKDMITLYLKIAYSENFDDRNMGSALDEIQSNHKTDIHLQMRIKI